MSQPTQPLYPDADGVLHPHPLGLVECTNEQYHSGPGVSKSHLDLIANASPLHYWHKYLSPDREPNEPTPAMILGSAAHAIILEPDLFAAEYVPNPGIDRRSKAGKDEYAAFQAEHAGKIILSDEDYQTCLHIRDAVYRDPVARGLLTGGTAEQSFYGIDEETGELIKCRTDYRHNEGRYVVDVKTTEDASPAGFGKSSANFRYPHQVAWYDDVQDAALGHHPQYWVFLAVEKKPPYALGLYFPEPEQIAKAREANRRALRTIAECKRHNEWPGYSAEVKPLKLPGWWKP